MKVRSFFVPGTPCGGMFDAAAAFWSSESMYMAPTRVYKKKGTREKVELRTSASHEHGSKGAPVEVVGRGNRRGGAADGYENEKPSAQRESGEAREEMADWVLMQIPMRSRKRRDNLFISNL